MIRINPKKNSIELTRGDSAYITLNVNDSTGKPYELNDGDNIRVQVRTAPNVGRLLFEGNLDTTGNKIVWHIKPEDTADEPVTTYWWDAQLETPNGDIFTFITSSPFILTDEVTMVRDGE